MMTDDNEAEVIAVEKVEEEAPPSSPPPSSPPPSSPPPSKSPVAMSRTDSGRVAADIGKFHLEVDAKQLPLAGFFMASFIFMVAAIAQKTFLDNWYAYAVTIGVIGMVLALVGLALLKYKTEFDQKYLGYVMLVWSIVGACLMTFGSGPFQATGNGYFAVWGMVIFAVQHCGATQQLKQGVQNLSSLAGLGLAAIVMIIAVSFEVNGFFRSNSIYTMILSCFTVVLVAGIMYAEQKEGMDFPVMYQFYTLIIWSILWIVAACLVTFNGPFVLTGNGYFTAWAATVLSLFATVGALQKAKGDDSPV
ncbi:hypothetical protein IV203_025721 [Nitzschia inconspicua]|uniref:Uncharacterized protein n=1 Tax=Nitzschia inconspicua TaxID=303405 RepID=A0A9K3LHM2_9STRA|nr:hypothetical protein IV203_025721 [Nitzschia inconspicua]